MRIARIKRGADVIGSWQVITDFERPEIRIKPILYIANRR